MGTGAPRDPSANLASRLRQARLRAGITVRELARQLGVSASFVSQLENGKSQPSVSTLYALAQCLGESLDHLFLDQDPPPSPADEERDGGGGPGPARPSLVDITAPGDRTRL